MYYLYSSTTNKYNATFLTQIENGFNMIHYIFNIPKLSLNIAIEAQTEGQWV